MHSKGKFVHFALESLETHPAGTSEQGALDVRALFAIISLQVMRPFVVTIHTTNFNWCRMMNATENCVEHSRVTPNARRHEGKNHKSCYTWPMLPAQKPPGEQRKMRFHSYRCESILSMAATRPQRPCVRVKTAICLSHYCVWLVH